MSISTQLAQALLAEIKSALDGGSLYVFAGPVPSTPDEALDMSGSHTQLVKLEASGAGLTFGAPVGNVLPKNATEVWEGVIAFVGANAGATSLAPTFYRFCANGDNGRAAATGIRLQGTAGGPASSAAILFGADTMTANGANYTGLGIYNVAADQVS